MGRPGLATAHKQGHVGRRPLGHGLPPASIHSVRESDVLSRQSTSHCAWS